MGRFNNYQTIPTPTNTLKTTTMANKDYKLIKENASGYFDEVALTPSENQLIGFDEEKDLALFDIPEETDIDPDDVALKSELGDSATKDVGIGSGDVAAGNHTHTDLHSHSNKATLDKIGESGGDPTWNGSAWNGSAWPGGGSTDQKISFGTAITAATADITAANMFKTTDVNRSTAVTLTLKKNVFAVGEWFVLVQTGDGQFKLDCDAEVTVPDWNKSAGKGFEMYVYCVDDTTDANVFRIVGGVE